MLAPLAVNVTLCPWQIFVEEGVIDRTGLARTVIVCIATDEPEPLEAVRETVYVPGVV